MAGLHNPGTLITADRHEVAQAAHWDDSSGSDFFFKPSAAQILGTGLAEDLTDVGWSISALAFVQGTGGDFFGANDLDPSYYLTDAASDLLQSPAIFGDYIHSQQASPHLGYDPTTLIMVAWNRFSVNSVDEASTCVGFTIGGGSIIVDADSVATIHSNGSNFVCRNSVDSDIGATDDGDWHLFKIVISTGSVTDAIEWFIDGVSQGTLDRREDCYPCAWGAGVESGATNRIQIGSCGVFYR